MTGRFGSNVRHVCFWEVPDMSNRFARIGLSTALGVGLVAGWASDCRAGPGEDRRRVKKSNGKVKVPTTKKKQMKKCKKGWKKVSWNQTGATGPTGPVGPTVRRAVAAGQGRYRQTIGKVPGYLPSRAAHHQRPDRRWSVSLLPGREGAPRWRRPPSFKTNTCNGTPYVESTSAQTTAFLVGSVGDPHESSIGPAARRWVRPPAWAFTATTENAVNVQTYALNNAGFAPPR